MTAKFGPLLTDSQLREWRSRVNQAYMDAIEWEAKAIRRDRRLRRYIRRHYGMNYGKIKGDE